MSLSKIIIIVLSFLITTTTAFFTSNIVIASILGLITLQFSGAQGIVFPNIFSIFTVNISSFLEEPEAFKLFASMMLLSGILELLITEGLVGSFVSFCFPNLGTGVYLDLLLVVFGFVFSCDDTILLLWLSSIFKSTISTINKHYKELILRKIIITDGMTNTLPWIMPFSSEAAYLIYCLKDSSDGISTNEHSQTYLKSILTMFYPIYYLISLVVSIIIKIYKHLRKVDSSNTYIKRRKVEVGTKRKAITIISVVSFPVIIWAGYFINGYTNLESNISIRNGIFKYIYTILWSASSSDALFNSSLVIFFFDYFLIRYNSKNKNIRSTCKKGIDDMLEIMIITLLANCFSQKIKELGVKDDLELILNKYNIQEYILIPLIYMISIITTILVGNSWFTIKIMIDLLIKRINKNNYILSSIVSGAAFGDKITLLSESRSYFASVYKFKIKTLTKRQVIKCWFIGLISLIFGHLLLSFLPLYTIYILGISFLVGVRILKEVIHHK